MLNFYSNYEVLKTSQETPEFQTRMVEELIDLDSKMCNLRKVINGDTPLQMPVKAAILLNKQYQAMGEYYQALFERCSYYNLISYNDPIPTTCNSN